MFKSDTMPRLAVRLSPDLRRWLGDEAQATGRTLNAVVIEAVQRMSVDQLRSKIPIAEIKRVVAEANLGEGNDDKQSPHALVFKGTITFLRRG